MMHEPMLMLALAVIVGLAIVLTFNGARKRRLKVKIEPLPLARLDNTPVRSEILSEVRVRERARAEALSLQAEKTAKEASAAAESPELVMPEPVDSIAFDELLEAQQQSELKPEAVSEAVSEVEPPAVKLSQADLFPEAIQAPKVPAVVEPRESSAPDLAIDRVLSVHVMATTQLFDGRHLLELLLQYGLRFGDMEIFHRHEHPTGQGEVLFSLAQAVEPGTFNIDTLERDLVPGVSFFMSLPGIKSTLAFDLMLDTARRLAHELQAELLDSQSSVLSAVDVEQWRDEVVAYERQHTQA